MDSKEEVSATSEEVPKEIPTNILVDMLKKTVLEKTDQVKALEQKVEALTRTVVA